jgi:hypothetical protein
MIVSLLSMAGASSALADDVSWILNRNGSWSTAANWVGGAPQTDDNAIFSSGVGTIDQSFSLGNFLFSGGALQGGNSISTSGTFSWSGGRFAGAGGTLTSNGALLISGSTLIDGRVLNNTGSAIWSAGDIQPYQLATANTINNLAGATFSIQSDRAITHFNAGATLSFNNAGYVRKETTTGTTRFTDASLFNSGTVDVQTGMLSLSFGSSTGIFNVANGATISFDTYSFNPGTIFTGPGTSRLTGAASFNTNLSINQLQQTNSFASIDGTGRVSIANQFDLQSGDLLGSGTLQINAGARMNVSSALGNSHYLFRSIDNFGTINWSGVSNVETGRGAVINNAGTWNFTSDQQLSRATTGNLPVMTIVNSGTLSKTAGFGSTSIEAAITNTGAISVTGGVLNLGAGGTSESGSTINIGTGATLRVGGGGFWIKNGSNITDSGTLDVSLGSLRANSTVLGSAHVLMNGFELGIDGNLDDNQFTWNRGLLSGAGTTTLMSDHTFFSPWGVGPGRALDTNGHNITWSDGIWGSGLGSSVFGYSGAGTIENRAGSTFSVNVNASISNVNDVVAINNAGTYAQGATTVYLSGEMNNSGTVILSGGTLVLQGGGNSSGTFGGSGTLILNGGSHSFSTASRINSLFLQVQSGAATLSGITTLTGLEVGDASFGAALQINAPLSTATFTTLAGSSVELNGAAVVASDSVILDQAAGDFREDGGIWIANNASITAAALSVRHATLDLQSGTITAGWFEVTGGTVNLGGAGHLTTSNLQLTGGAINVAPGFAWPTSTFASDGSAIDLKGGVSLSFTTASTISAGGLVIEPEATLSVDSMSHAGSSQVLGTLNVVHELTNSGEMSMSGMIAAENFHNAGMLSGAGTLNGNLQNDGVLIPGNPTGSVTINGGLSLSPASQIEVQIDGTPAPLQSPDLAVTGVAHLDGAMILVFLNDAILLPHHPTELMHWSSHTGTFSSFAYYSPYPGMSYRLTYTGQQLSVTGDALWGDASLDGVVNAMDFNVVARHFGMAGSATWLQGDFNDDHVVDAEDFTMFASHFGERLPATGTVAPEGEYEVAVLVAVLATRRKRRG